MSLSAEQIELADPTTPRSRRWCLRAWRLGRFIATTALAMLATGLLVVLAAILYFGAPVVLLGLMGAGQ